MLQLFTVKRDMTGTSRRGDAWDNTTARSVRARWVAHAAGPRRRVGGRYKLEDN